MTSKFENVLLSTINDNLETRKSSKKELLDFIKSDSSININKLVFGFYNSFLSTTENTKRKSIALNTILSLLWIFDEETILKILDKIAEQIKNNDNPIAAIGCYKGIVDCVDNFDHFSEFAPILAKSLANFLILLMPDTTEIDLKNAEELKAFCFSLKSVLAITEKSPIEEKEQFLKSIVNSFFVFLGHCTNRKILVVLSDFLAFLFSLPNLTEQNLQNFAEEVLESFDKPITIPHALKISNSILSQNPKNANFSQNTKFAIEELIKKVALVYKSDLSNKNFVIQKLAKNNLVEALRSFGVELFLKALPVQTEERKWILKMLKSTKFSHGLQFFFDDLYSLLLSENNKIIKLDFTTNFERFGQSLAKNNLIFAVFECLPNFCENPNDICRFEDFMKILKNLYEFYVN
ncbi:hypothetical protein MHBO_001388, partial [Bonamia ostreae]